MGADESLRITAGAVEALVAPALGGRVAQVTIDSVPLLIGADASDDPMRWGSYPMVPWAGRTRNGVFRFQGVDHQLPVNSPPHAIHGFGFVSEWRVEQHTASQVRLSLDLGDTPWPFGGRVHQTIAVDPAGVSCAMSLVADVPMPYSMGWHPWFRKPSRIEFAPSAMYRRDDDYIAVDELIPVPPGPWDDCFVNERAVELDIDGVVVAVRSDERHWVVFDMLEHATCVEPQTGPPDALNLSPRIAAPGRSGFASFRIERNAIL